MKRFPVYILAGGRSSRFGSDKARVVIDGEPSVARVARWARPFASSVTVVADVADKYADLKLRTIADAGGPHHGPVEGMVTALQDCPEDRLLLLACDMLALRETWIDLLGQHQHPGVRAVAFKGEFWQPFPSLLHRSALDEIVAARAEGIASVQKLYDRLNAVAVEEPADWPRPHQFNRPTDLRR